MVGKQGEQRGWVETEEVRYPFKDRSKKSEKDQGKNIVEDDNDVGAENLIGIEWTESEKTV